MEQEISAEAMEVLRLLTRGIVPASTRGQIATELLRAGFAVDTVAGLEPTETGRRYVAAQREAIAKPAIPPDNA